MNRCIGILSIVLILSTQIYSATFDSATFGGHVNDINSIVLANEVTNLNLDATNSNVKIFDITGSHNKSTGFYMRINSANQGQLRSIAFDSGKPGTYLPYTIDLIVTNSPAATTLPSNLINIDLSGGEHVIDYVTNVNAATIDATWDVQLSHGSHALFEGNYTDTITIEFTDI